LEKKKKIDMNKVLIIGYGIVGQNLACELERLEPKVVDKYKEIGCSQTLNTQYDLAFVCVDTPLKGDTLDITEVENALVENNSKIYVIKSTCPIGTCDKLKEKYHKRIIFSPEYYGNTQHCNNFDFDFTILGGDKKDCLEVQQILQKCYDARHIFRIVDSQLAELVKFMENSWLAAKVSFCCEFFDICNKYGLNYEELRELFILDPRVNPSHTFIYNDAPYWDSHCLNKDISYIAQDGELLKSIIDFNLKRKKKNKYINR